MYFSLRLMVMLKKCQLFIVFCAWFLLGGCSSSNSPEQKILDRLQLQSECWNSGDLECFMVGYWQSDSLMFIGKSGVVYGYENTLKRYERTYPDKATMGQLNFDIQHVNKISEDSYFVVGKYHLTREIGDAEGYFSLLWRLIDGEWTIVADHSS